MQRRQFLAVAGTLATGATRLPDHRNTHPQLARMQLALWRALDACEAFAHEHAKCDCAAHEGAVCYEISETPYLLRLLADVLAGLSRARRPAPGPLPAAAMCEGNDPRHVATILALRDVIAAGREAYHACPLADCHVCEHLLGIANSLESPCSLLESVAYWCVALKGKSLTAVIAEDMCKRQEA